MLTVMKFGGSIIASTKELKQIAEILKERRKKEQVLIVASAVQGITDSIINGCNDSMKNTATIKDFIEKTRKRHIELLAEIKNDEIRKKTSKKIDSKLEQLEKALYGISFLKELSEKSCALIYPMGEQLSVLLLEAYLNDNGVNAIAFDADEAGIVTNNCYSEAIPIMEKTRENLGKKIKPLLTGTVPVITGYFAADSEGNKTCFGRGGSDFSAGIIANALDANALELWKDVDGFMSADPKIVQNAKLIKDLSYEEAEELGYFGAKILHPKTIPPLREKNIPAIVKNIFKPDIEGTIISGKKNKVPGIIKSIATKKGLAAITISSPEFVGHAGIIAKVFSPIAEAGISIDTVATSETTVSFTLAEKDLEKAKSATEKIPLRMEKISFETGLSLLGLVGEGLRSEYGITGKIFSCLAEEKINDEIISQGSNEVNLSIIIQEKDLEKAVKAIHKKIME